MTTILGTVLLALLLVLVLGVLVVTPIGRGLLVTGLGVLVWLVLIAGGLLWFARFL